MVFSPLASLPEPLGYEAVIPSHLRHLLDGPDHTLHEVQCLFFIGAVVRIAETHKDHMSRQTRNQAVALNHLGLQVQNESPNQL